MPLGYRNEAKSEVAVISSDPSYKAQQVRAFRAKEVFPQLLDPSGPTLPTLKNNAGKLNAVHIGPDVLAKHPKAVSRITAECRDLGLNLIQH